MWHGVKAPGWCAMAVMVAVCLHGTASAVDVWMPETGEVALEETPRDTVELRRQHAFALIGAGEWAGGVGELRVLMAAAPDAPWVAEARLAIARAFLTAGRYRDAFEEIGPLAESQADSALAHRARDLQFQIARATAPERLGLALKFYDRLLESAPTAEDAVYAQKERADAFFATKRFMDAEDTYMSIIRDQPRSVWTPYCWFKVADCNWQLARWLDLGLERIKDAEQLFADFLETYPADDNSAEARAKRVEAREAQAELHGKVSEYYIEVERKPWAAVNYLTYIRDQFKDTARAGWAAEQLEAIEDSGKAPLPGRFHRFDLPGVETARRNRTTVPQSPGGRTDE